MPKLTLTDIASGYASVTELNQNFTAIENAIENTVSRDGTTPNQMTADLDMNSNDILNASVVNTENLRINGELLTTSTIVVAPDSSQVNYTPAGTGAVDTTVQAKLRESVSVKDFGAVGDGVADDTAALVLAEAAAFASGAILLFPEGTYLQNDYLNYRCSISGYGATIKNTKGSEQSNGVYAVVRFSSVSNLFVEGLTVDGNNWSTGFSATSGNHITYRDCKAINCMYAGFNAYYCNYTTYLNCKAIGVNYLASDLIASDGFYVGACNDTSYTNCHAEDFERIGFVSEGESANKSYRTRYVSCLAKNGNNHDRSVAQYNTGFWVENTNGVFMDDITVLDMAGNAGQTAARIRGITLTAVGDNTDSVAVLSNFTIGDSSGTIPVAIIASGSVDTTKVIVRDGMVFNANVGVVSLGNIDSLTVDNVLFSDMVYSSGSKGGVVIDLQAGANTLGSLTCRSLREINPTYTSDDAGTVNWYNGSDTEILVEDCQDITVVVRGGGVNVITLDNCKLNYRSTNYGVLNGVQNYATNCTFTYVSGTGNVVVGSAAPTGAKALISNCRFSDFDGVMGSTSTTIQFSNCSFANCHFDWFPQTSGFLSLNGCTWINDTLDDSCITTNFYAATSANKLVVVGNYFDITDNTKVAFEVHANGGPDDYIICNNMFGTNAAITDITGGTSAIANNIQF